jgi:L-fuconolactonase
VKIDSHHHLWRYRAEDYPWMLDGMEAIRRDFLSSDLAKAASSAGIDGTVAVQARQQIAETEFLLNVARENPLVRGVVGWVDLSNDAVNADLERFAADPKLKGVRHVLHDEPDDAYMLRPDFNRGVARLIDYGLTYDILIFERHLENAIRFVDQHPLQVFIVDHCAKPGIREGLISPWREQIVELARRENVCCKISGMVTEADWQNWTAEQLQPYIDILLRAFGPNRLMFGSDWPVMLVACPYLKWVRVMERAISTLSPEERNRIMGGVAIDTYRL